MGVHELGLRIHGGNFGADGVRAVLLLPQLHQLLGKDLTRLPVTTLGHFLDLRFLEKRNQYCRTLQFKWKILPVVFSRDNRAFLVRANQFDTCLESVTSETHIAQIKTSIDKPTNIPTKLPRGISACVNIDIKNRGLSG